MKKHVYQLEKQKVGLQESFHDLEANEHSALIGAGADAASTDALFIPLLDRELKKVCLFYETEEQRLSDEVTALQQEVEQHELNGPYAGPQYLDDEDPDDEDDDDFDLHSPIRSGDSPARQRRRHSRSLSAGVGPSGTCSMHFMPPRAQGRRLPMLSVMRIRAWALLLGITVLNHPRPYFSQAAS